jgi:hypothetical protein
LAKGHRYQDGAQPLKVTVIRMQIGEQKVTVFGMTQLKVTVFGMMAQKILMPKSS